MRYLIFFIVFCVFSLNLIFSQNTKFSIDLFIQPSIDNRNTNFPFQNDLSYKYGTDFGIDCSYSIIDDLKIISGLNYINRGYSFTLEISKIKLASYDSYTPRFDKLVSSFNYNYMTIPIKIGYSIKLNNFELMPTIGVGFGYLFDTRTRSKIILGSNTDYKTTKHNVSDYYSRVSVSGILSLDISGSISDNLSFFLTPNYDLMLTPIEKNNVEIMGESIKTYYWNVGCKLGIRKRI